jgi:glycine/D-amino acid oxidase-like deaminating enzyme
MPLSPATTAHATTLEIDADVVVIGGGSAGSTAALEAQRHLPVGRVVLLEKAHIKRSGAIAIGMDGLNNAVIPGIPLNRPLKREIFEWLSGILSAWLSLAKRL